MEISTSSLAAAAWPPGSLAAGSGEENTDSSPPKHSDSTNSVSLQGPQVILHV